MGYPKVSNIERIGFQMRTGVPYRRNGGAPVTRRWRKERNWWNPDKGGRYAVRKGGSVSGQDNGIGGEGEVGIQREQGGRGEEGREAWAGQKKA